MANIPDSLLKVWAQGETITADTYVQEREIIKTAVNDNYARLLERYTKAEVDSLLTAVGAGQSISVRILPDLPLSTNQGEFLLNASDWNLYYRTEEDWMTVATQSYAQDLYNTLDAKIDEHLEDTSNPHNVTVSQIGAIPVGEKGANNGVATLGSNGTIPENQIPKGLVAYTKQSDQVLKPKSDPSKSADIGIWIDDFSTFTFARERGYMDLIIEIDASGLSSQQNGGVVYGTLLPYRLYINDVLKSTGTGDINLSYKLDELGLSVGSTVTVRLSLQHPTSNDTPSRVWLQGNMGIRTNTVFQTI